MVRTKKISISINEELERAIDILANVEGISRSRLIESILNNDPNVKRVIDAVRAESVSGVYAVSSKKAKANQKIEQKSFQTRSGA